MINPQTYVVLQGEVGVVQNANLKCPTPTACHIVTFFHQPKNISVMMHIDDYIDVQATFNCAEAILRSSYSESLTSPQFVGKIMGGSNNSFSLKQQDAILRILQRLGIQFTQVQLSSPRQQITLNASDGKLSFSMNKSLEYLQLREYGSFNDYLDFQFRNSDGVDIPFFEARKAVRPEPHFPCIDQLSGDRTTWIRSAQDLERRDQFKLSMINVYRPDIPPISVAKRALAGIQIPETVAQPIQKGDFNLALRRTASHKERIHIFQILLKYASSLQIDLTSKGRTSGSVWDVAQTSANRQALETLGNFPNQYTSSSLCSDLQTDLEQKEAEKEVKELESLASQLEGILTQFKQTREQFKTRHGFSTESPTIQHLDSEIQGVQGKLDYVKTKLKEKKPRVEGETSGNTQSVSECLTF